MNIETYRRDERPEIRVGMVMTDMQTMERLEVEWIRHDEYGVWIMLDAPSGGGGADYDWLATALETGRITDGWDPEHIDYVECKRNY